MKKILLISLLLFSKISFSQVYDSFYDGDFAQNPIWKGDVSYFQINAQKQLQSNGQQAASQTISLSTVNNLSSNASWEFFMQLNFDPTTSNFVRVYLTSDQENLKGSLNGYFVQIGETGATDGFHLYKQTGNSITRIITGSPKARPNANLIMAKVKVTRDASGKWELLTDVTGGNVFNLEGTVIDNALASSEFAGVYCRYVTASRYNQFIFDDFQIEDLVPDVTPPNLKSIAVVDALNVDVTFSEPLDLTSALNKNHYTLSNGYGNPVLVSATASSNVYRLTFSNNFISGSYNLLATDLKDLKGNVISPNSSLSFTYIKPYFAQYGDVVINEIFANPAGNLSLPQKEYIELWNTTNQYILTKGWKYADQSSTHTFLTDTIKPNEHVILTAKADEPLFKLYGKTIGLSLWPSLNNDQDVLTLSNEQGKIIDQVSYADRWYKDDKKKKGGYSLELIDPKNICKGIQNWNASVDVSGGTPGRQNAVYQAQLSTEIPKLQSAHVIDSVTIQVNYSKSVDSLTAVQLSNYSLNNSIGNPIFATIESSNFSSVTLKLAQEMARGVENNLTIQKVTDCAGNFISSTENSATLFMAKRIGRGDILISELLFNPRFGGADFVEIYNHTNHVLDLRDLQLANADATGKPSNVKNISTKNLFIPPNTYWVITTDALNIKQNYETKFPSQFVQLASLPAFGNDKGAVILLSRGQVVDQLNYTSAIHHPLIQDNDGISIERVSFEVDANNPDNFKSAAATVGYATPTYKNSQQASGGENYVNLLSKTFSPDGDGFEDVMSLEYKMAEHDCVATVNVFSDKGHLVRRLLKNQTISTEGSLTWDGLGDHGEVCAIGIYVISFDVFNPKGNVKHYRNTCVLAGKLN
ncbi:hypothetical protein DHW03_12250 [Pedobacter yonginense]|uniref:LTD domain-containing protein n=1 Tax=Pedobacter yonginense TaxID=651869 RepID=A0A317EKX5_9SPHI|nr:lamin tail domain-containing protein [Pedobacter yonginense]PWS26797.1 hypothetical protein DHW03_12250 [Pedobacter yonginense]